MKPRGDVLGVGDGAGKEQELELGRRGEQGALVVVAAGGICEPVVFVDDEEVEGREVVGARGVGGGDLALDGLEGGDNERGGGVNGDVAGDDAHAPTPGTPFGVFVVGKGARWDGKERAAGEIRLLSPALEDVGFAGAGGSVDHDVAASLKGTDRLGLPAVGEDEFLKAGESVGQHKIERARARRRVKPCWDFSRKFLRSELRPIKLRNIAAGSHTHYRGCDGQSFYNFLPVMAGLP
jgi:hypothetical protein